MTKWMRAFCVVAIGIVVLSMGRIFEALPSPPLHKASEKYERWAGVLRLWVCEGWEAGNGSLSSWLNTVTQKFEKRHNGVYIQVSYVTPSSLQAFAYGTENPPDMLLFSPGCLETPEALYPIGPATSLCAEWADYADGYAVPVAMGGYAWAINTRMIREVPTDWSETSVRMVAPVDTDTHSWSGAILALCSGQWINREGETYIRPQVGVDLGLPVPTVTPRAETLVWQPNHLPAAFFRAPDAYTQFINETCAVTIVTQREVRKLNERAAAGKGPEFEIVCTGEGFTDQIALMAIVDVPRKDHEARIDMCRFVIEHMLSEESQSALRQSRAFPVTAIPAIYGGQRGMEAMETALLTSSTIQAPPAFGNDWRTQVARGLSAFQAGEDVRLQSWLHP